MNTHKTAQFTPGPWVAIKGDTFNPERPWGVSKYLSREAHIEIDGDDKEYPCRTEVIAELTETENPQEVEHTAYLIAAAPAMYEALAKLRLEAIHYRNTGVGVQFLNHAIDQAELAINQVWGEGESNYDTEREG